MNDEPRLLLCTLLSPGSKGLSCLSQALFRAKAEQLSGVRRRAEAACRKSLDAAAVSQQHQRCPQVRADGCHGVQKASGDDRSIEFEDRG